MDRNRVSGDCWVVCFDILGFKNILRIYRKENQSGLEGFVESYYNRILNELRRVGQYSPEDVSIAWFSDTFLLFSRDNKHHSLVSINQAATHFFEKAIENKIPLRGSLAVGELYVDPSNSVFLGQAIIDAYQYGEKQDWIGFIITPDACARLMGMDIHPDCWEYVKHDVPVKKNRRETLYAYRPESDNIIRELLYRSVCQMQIQAKNQHPKEYEESYKSKYEHTKEFLKS